MVCQGGLYSPGMEKFNFVLSRSQRNSLRRVNYLKVNNQILTFIFSIRNLEIGLLKIRKNSKSSYFNQYVSLNKRNVQGLWTGSRSMLNVGKCKNSYITSILNKISLLTTLNTLLTSLITFLAWPMLVRLPRRVSPGKSQPFILSQD